MRYYFLFLSLFLYMQVISQKTTTLQWQVGHSKSITEAPKEFIAATVPGAVQLDIAKAKNYGPYYYAENWKDYLWMEDLFYTYKTKFSQPALSSTDRLYFISKGIDYEFDIYLNNEKLFSQGGMFTWVKLDLTDKLKADNELRIIVHPVPKLHVQPVDRSQAAHVVKPAVSYQWDWHPRLVPLGIWDDTYLQVLPASNITDVWVNYDLNDQLNKANINIGVKGINLSGKNFSWKLLDKNNKEVISKSGAIQKDITTILNTEFNNPQLWWPHDYGTPYLYHSVFELKDENSKTLQTVSQKVGFRRVKMVMNEGAWIEPVEFPKTRSVAPAQFVVNGVKIFAKGTNWVNPEIFPGIITAKTYNALTDKALEANFNMLRVWGGGIVNKESFYEQCNEKGLLVWQEFPLACNNYPDDPHYLSILEQEAISIVDRLKKHPSIALWSGGNELFNAWSGMTDQSHALRLLNAVTYDHDRKTPFIPTSPVFGMAHGHYVFRDPWNGEEVYAVMKRAKNTAYTEFGMPSPSSVEILKKIIPQNELWPPKEGTSWESHHAFKAWAGETWLMPKMLEDYFGPAKNLEELVERGQLLQCEGYKAIYEEARRQKPYCAMALNWCYNEPWYTAANNSIINYPAQPKPAFYAVRDACRPVSATARISKLKWLEGEAFTTQPWMLNDLNKKVAAGTVIVKLVAGNNTVELQRWNFNELQGYANAEGPITAPYKLPAWDVNRFKVVVEVEGKPEYKSEYTVLYQPTTPRQTNQTRALNQ